MAITYSKFFEPTVLPLVASLVTLYTVKTDPASNLLRGARVRLTNTTASPATARLHAVPSLGTAIVGNAFFYDGTVPANGYVDVDVPIMKAGDSLQAGANTATAINIQAISGGVFSS